MNKKLIFSEIILLLASVLVFRGAWELIGTLDVMHETWALWFSLVVGLALAVFCMNYIIRQRRKQQ